MTWQHVGHCMLIVLNKKIMNIYAYAIINHSQKYFFIKKKHLHNIIIYMYIKIHIKQYIICNTLLNNDQIDGISEVCTIDISKSSLK